MSKKNEIPPEKQLWNDKAVAFVIRAQHELWGKHNEDPLVWFFKNGFKNQFIKNFMIGWNRHSKLRNAKNWGIAPSTITDTGFPPGKLFFPEGLVIPYIVDKNLKKITIFKHTSESPEKIHVVPGSSEISMVLGKKTKTIAVVEHIMDGLYLHQEAAEKLCVVIPHGPTIPPDKAVENVLHEAETILFCYKSPTVKYEDISKTWAGVHHHVRRLEYHDKDDMVLQAISET